MTCRDEGESMHSALLLQETRSPAVMAPCHLNILHADHNQQGKDGHHNLTAAEDKAALHKAHLNRLRADHDQQGRG